MTSPWPEGVVARHNEPLHRHSPWRVGGPCSAWVVVHRREALGPALAACKAEGLKMMPFGAGTRTIYGDGHHKFAMLRLGTDFQRIVRDGSLWTVGAGVPIPALVGAAAAAGFDGLSDLVRAGGSVGALLKLDEGPWTKQVRTVTVFQRGKEREVDLADAQKGRSLVTGVTFELLPADPAELHKAICASLGGKRAKDRPVPGCFWEKIPKRSLVNTMLNARLAGVRLRGVTIPESAPLCIVNLGGGTATDMGLLIRSAVDRVQRDIGETLVVRPRMVGHHRRGK